MKKGDRALLVFLPSLEFIVAFLGCLRAGVIAVPVYPPVNVKKSLQSFASIADTSDAKVALTHSGMVLLKQEAMLGWLYHSFSRITSVRKSSTTSTCQVFLLSLKREMAFGQVGCSG